MTKAKPKRSLARKLLRVLLSSVLALVAVVGVLLFLLSLPAVQQRLTREAESWLRQKLHTRVEIGSIRVRPPYSVALKGFLIEDQRGDTLARIGSLAVQLDLWKLLDRTIELQNVTLENAGVRLHTRDGINNYDFIVAAFTNPDTTAASPADTTASPWQLRLDLAMLQLKNVDFSLQDEDAGASTEARIGQLEAVVGSADVQHLRFQIDEFLLKNSNIRLVQNKDTPDSGRPSPAFAVLVEAGRIDNSQLFFSTPKLLLDARLAKTELTNFSFQSADDRTAILLEKLKVENSALVYRDPQNPPTPGHFNAGDLAVQNLNADLANFSLQNDTLALQAQALSGTEKSGVQLYELRGHLQVAPDAIVLRDARLHANRTTLDGDAVLFKNETATFDRMQIALREVRGVVGDLIVFLPPLKNPVLTKLADLIYTASGHLDGSLQNMRLTELRATAGQGTALHANGSIQHLDDPDRLGFDLRLGQIRTVRPDLLRLMTLGDTPLDSVLQTPLPAWAEASGTLRGNLAAMTVDLQGEVGALETGGKIQGNSLTFSLSGALTTDPDRLGMDVTIRKLEAPRAFFAFLEPRGLVLPDRLSAAGMLRGTLAELNTKLEISALRDGGESRVLLDGVLRNLNQPENPGMDIVFSGELTRAEMLGYLSDSGATKVLNLPASVAFGGKAKGTPRDLEGNVGLRLGALGALLVQGTLKDSTYRAEIVAENLRVGQLAADTALRAVHTVGILINVEGSGFDVWNTATLNAAGRFDSLIYNNLILRDLVFDASVDGRRFDAGVKSPDARAGLNLRAQGDFTGAVPVLETDLTINCLDLREFGWAYRPSVMCLRLRSQSEGLSPDTMLAKITLENIDLQYDTVHVRPGDVTLNLRLDHRDNLLAIRSDWLEGELEGYFSLTDLPTTLSNIAEQYFIVDRSNDVRPLGTDSLSLRLNLLRPQVLTTGLIPGLVDLGTLRLNGSLNARTNFFDLTAQLTRLHYQNWALDSLNARAFAGDSAALFSVSAPEVRNAGEFFAKNTGINGSFVANRATATLSAKDRDDRDRFLVGVQAEWLSNRGGVAAHLQEKLVLDFQNWNVSPDNRIEGGSGGVKIENLALHGDGGQSIHVAGSTRPLTNGQTGLDFNIGIGRLHYDNFAIFVANTVRDLTGWADAKLTIGGTTDAPEVRGTMQLHETAFTPALTNVHYQLSEMPLEFTAGGISLDGLTLRDPFGRELNINGRLITQNWQDITANLSLDADEFQVLNTTRQQNSTYFGRLFVSVDGRVRGPLTAPQVTASIRTAKKSEFTYVYDADAQVVRHEGIVVFVEPARRYVRPPVYDAPAAAAGLTLSASIEIDSNLAISTVVNPVTGDDFRGAADGRLQFDIFPNGNMTLTGRVDLVRGVYEYSYQSVVKRSFQIALGSYLLWTGDAADPELNLIARYEFRASPYPLVVSQLASATPEETAQYRRAQTFFLQTNIAGTPREPNVDFKFIYPSDQDNQGLIGNFGNRDAGLVGSAIRTLNADPNLLSRQVFGVLLLRSFLGETAVATSTLGGDPLRSGLTSFLTNQINALAAQYLTFVDVSVEARDAATGDGSSAPGGATEYELRLQKSFFDDRLTFKISGATAVEANGDAGQSGLENASVEYAVTRDGALKLTVFSERGFEMLNASSLNLRNSGVGVVVTKEFKGSRKRRKNRGN